MKRQRPNDWDNDMTPYMPPKKLGCPKGTKDLPIDVDLLEGLRSKGTKENPIEIDLRQTSDDIPDVEIWEDSGSYDIEKALEEGCDPDFVSDTELEKWYEVHGFKEFEVSSWESPEDSSEEKLRKDFMKVKSKRSKICDLPPGEECDCEEEVHRDQQFDVQTEVYHTQESQNWDDWYNREYGQMDIDESEERGTNDESIYKHFYTDEKLDE